ncbi:MAG: radical SAM family heme chaperone HemW [Muribaculaceae bacterium]
MSGLYIHIPFCQSKCAYCDFFSAPSMLTKQKDYIKALLKELELRKNEVPNPFSTIYIGGGTPSILDSETLNLLFAGLSSYINDNIKEFTIEVNPEDVSENLIKTFSANGVNRISMGIQSFDDDTLKLISRRHNSQKAANAINIIKSFNLNFSCDLIYGLPSDNSHKKSNDLFEYSLDKLLSFAPPHISAYLLSFEKGTQIYSQREKGLISEISDEEAEEAYKYLCDTLRNAGYNHYEISNFALPGKEALHNSNYWNYTPYLGLGCSAHSFDGTLRRYNPNNIPQYISSILNNNKTIFITEETDDIERYNDLIITSLRTAAGLNIKLIENSFPEFIQEYFHKESRKMISSGLLLIKKNVIYIPEDNWLTSDYILRNLIYA